eukprot:766444-Hanusia_phi.AAC.3
MALRERDAAEVRAQMEQESLQKLQAEMVWTTAQLNLLKEKSEDKSKTIETLQAESRSLRDQLQRSVDFHLLTYLLLALHTALPLLPPPLLLLPFTCLTPALQGGDAPKGAHAEQDERGAGREEQRWRKEALLAKDMIASLQDLIACGQDEVDLLHKRLDDLAADVHTKLQKVEEGNEEGGEDGARERQAFTVEEWRHMIQQRYLEEGKEVGGRERKRGG